MIWTSGTGWAGHLGCQQVIARIMIVDDHAVVRKMLKALVETREGWKVCCEAENGKQALERLAECKPDLIVMDRVMPVQDGISASREISAQVPLLPIVMHTLHDSPELALEAKKAGVRAIVAKTDSGQTVLTLRERYEAKTGTPQNSSSPSFVVLARSSRISNGL